MLKKIFLFHEIMKKKRYLFVGKIYAWYYTHAFAECGKNLKIYGKPIIFNPEKIHVGNNVTINNGVQLCPRGDIYIGDYVTMSRGSQITAGSLDTNNWTNSRYKVATHIEKDVHISEGTWLCTNSIILPGVNISGKAVVVAAGAVVTNNIEEDYCIIGGVPAKVVKRLDRENKA